jgi:hypothetical protein
MPLPVVATGASDASAGYPRPDLAARNRPFVGWANGGVEANALVKWQKVGGNFARPRATVTRRLRTLNVGGDGVFSHRPSHQRVGTGGEHMCGHS